MSETMSITHSPTNSLRFVLRWEGDRQVRILQQMFVPADDWERFDVEWRDVPLVNEP